MDLIILFIFLNHNDNQYTNVYCQQIPSSAVEMPGELGSSSISTLDVQFGALDLGSETIPFLTDNVSSISNSVSNDKYNTVVSIWTTLP